MSRFYLHNKIAKNYSGKEFHTVAKISLWESQHELIDQMFRWTETCDFIFKWYETNYDENQLGFSKYEVSFIFFLKKTEINDFLKSVPKQLKKKIRLESFDIEIYNYYLRDMVVSKHPNTP